MNLIVPPPAQTLLAAGGVWMLDRLFPALSVDLPFQKALAFAIAGVGLIIAGIAVFGFLKSKTTVNPHTPAKTSTLVTTGIYKVSRNPMYLGMLLLLSAWSIWIGNLSAIGVLAAFVAYMTIFQIKPEEEALLKIFDDAYRAYCKKMRRWV